ncbi:hypothetical protein [Flavobacterium ovatum]|jgi:hypothetical protein|uniref:hypothetical protein n=1 Tax=Flavobacterium ovatum TaxID=1928857 RepID=UPI00344CDC34
MKTNVIILSLMVFVTLSSCNSKTDPKAILENPNSRKELFSTIANDHDLMTEFMVNMQGNKMMIGNMMGGNGMQMMMKDSTMSVSLMQGMMGNHVMMQSMMTEMMKDPKMLQSMMQMMQQGGMMSKECMQSGMKMMGSKGMGMMNENK